MDALDAIWTRKSVRSYTSDAVDYNDVEILVKAAGSAAQTGGYHISVVLSQGLLQEINDKARLRMQKSGNAFLLDRVSLPGYQPMYGAPLMLVFSAPERNPYSLANTSNAATTAMIAATALGLGSCYAVTPCLALNAEKALADKVGVPDGYKSLCCMLAGHAGDERFATQKLSPPQVNYCR